MINWIKDRISERTSWDGAVCIALGLMILFMAPLAKIAAIVRPWNEFLTHKILFLCGLPIE